MNSNLDILRKLITEDEEEIMKNPPKTFEDDPMNFILNKYQSLKENLVYLMGDNFQEYLTAIYIIAPKPTMFKIVLHNNQYFFMTYMGDNYQVTISGKNYLLFTAGEKQRAMLALTRLLRWGSPLKTKGAEGAEETGTEETTGSAAEEAPPAESSDTSSEEGGGESETLEESLILRELLYEKVEDSILNILKKNKNINSLNPEKIVKDKSGAYKVYFKDINTRDKKARLDAMKQIISTKGINAKIGKGLSSIGHLNINTKSGPIKVIFKGSSETATSTNVKEGLVILFFYSGNIKPISKETFDKVLNQLKNKVIKLKGVSNETRSELINYLSNLKNTPENISNLNQPLSQANTIKEKYSNFNITRTGIFDEYRSVAHEKLGLPADKWCPGDIYAVIDEAKARSILEKVLKQDESQAAGILNKAFVTSWGKVNGPLVAVSLKFEKAQGGKAKAYFDKFKTAKTDYNLTDDEQKYSQQNYRDGIAKLRKNIISASKKNSNIKYILPDNNVIDIKKDQLKGKYAALKAIDYFFTQIINSEGIESIDDGLLALAAFAMSLGDISPTFFKVIADSSGTKGKIETFDGGSALSLLIDDKIQPITITDSVGYGGLTIEILASKKKDEKVKITISARNNGTTQGTIEIQKIQDLS